MTDVQDALEAAFEEHETDTHEPHGTKELPLEKPTEEEQTDERGNEETQETEGEERDEKRTDTEESPEPDPKESESLKPPVGWTAAAKEEFAKAPKAVQQEVLKREREIGKALTESGEARKMLEPVQKLFGQYQHLFNTNGTDPVTGTAQILQTAAMLQMGTPMQKVDIVSNIIRNFGIDVGMLDQKLGGVAPKPNPEVEHLYQKLSQTEQYIQQQQAREQHKTHQEQLKINSQVEDFVQKHEFAGDLRMTMADFIDLAEQQGSPIDLDTAYKRALATRPDLQEILNNRQSRSTNEQNVSKARQANVSLPQSTSPADRPKEPSNMREALEAAFDGT